MIIIIAVVLAVLVAGCALTALTPGAFSGLFPGAQEIPRSGRPRPGAGQ